MIVGFYQISTAQKNSKNIFPDGTKKIIKKIGQPLPATKGEKIIL